MSIAVSKVIVFRLWAFAVDRDTETCPKIIRQTGNRHTHHGFAETCISTDIQTRRDMYQYRHTDIQVYTCAHMHIYP